MIDEVDGLSKRIDIKWGRRSIAETDGRWNWTTALLVTDRYLVVSARYVYEVEDAAVVLIKAVHKLGESQFMCSLLAIELPGRFHLPLAALRGWWPWRPWQRMS
jgi:hypothetical protein